jgi:hypothetical protein
MATHRLLKALFLFQKPVNQVTQYGGHVKAFTIRDGTEKVIAILIDPHGYFPTHERPPLNLHRLAVAEIWNKKQAEGRYDQIYRRRYPITHSLRRIIYIM